MRIIRLRAPNSTSLTEVTGHPFLVPSTNVHNRGGREDQPSLVSLGTIHPLLEFSFLEAHKKSRNRSRADLILFLGSCLLLTTSFRVKLTLMWKHAKGFFPFLIVHSSSGI